MELETARLRTALDRLHRIVPARVTIPVLTHIAIEPDPDGTRLTATDLDIEASEVVPCASLDRPVPVTVPGRMLADLVRKCAGGNIRIEVVDDGARVRVRHGRAVWNLNALDIRDFPRFTRAAPPTVVFDLPGDVLATMIGTVAFAVATEETRYYLNGAYLHLRPGDTTDLAMVTTDGHRLALMRVPAPDGCAGMPPVIVPRTTLAEIARLAAGAKEKPVRIGITDRRIEISHGQSTLTSKLVDGTFPDYLRVIPEGGSVAVRIDRQALEDAADRAGTLSAERGRALKLGLTDAATLTVSVANIDVGDASETVPAEIQNPDGVECIGVNGRYLRDNLAVMTGGTVVLRMRDAGAPIRIEDPDRSDRLFVLMPMRV